MVRRLGSSMEPVTVAHRIVHGGGVFHAPTRLTPAILRRLKKFTPLAPDHMPPNLQGVALATHEWPRAGQWGVFDTSLYDRLPAAQKTYAIPLGLAKKFHIRKYGFHGISHQWALQQAAHTLRRPIRSLNAITIHLGSGDSITRWRRGAVEDTSMGFTPLEGLTMATRSGDLDPMIPIYLQEHGGFSAHQVANILQHRSGLVGISGLTDVRDVLGAAGHPVAGYPRRQWSTTQQHHAQLALDMFCYDIQRYVASYLGLLPRCDVIVLTGAVGQNTYLRDRIIRGVPAARAVQVISVPANEEQAIAEAVWKMIE